MPKYYYKEFDNENGLTIGSIPVAGNKNFFTKHPLAKKISKNEYEKIMNFLTQHPMNADNKK